MVVRKNVAGGVRDDRLTLDGEPWPLPVLLVWGEAQVIPSVTSASS